VCTATGNQNLPCITADGSGGAIIAWQDGRSGTSDDIYASKVSSNGQIVPVKLLSFTAERKGHTANLTWRTASEVNNYGFDIERKVFRTWETIGFVNGHGSSTTPETYQYQDHMSSTILHADHILYRLRQIDMDGTFDYSPIVEVRTGSAPRTPELYPPYPNPAAGHLMIPVYMPDEAPVTLTISNVSGQQLKTVRSGVVLGSGFHSFPVSTAGLPQGAYLVEMVAGTITKTQKVTVMG